MSTNRHWYFRWTPRTARITLMYVVVVPGLLLLLAKKTEVRILDPEHWKYWQTLIPAVVPRGSTSLEGRGKETLSWNTRRGFPVRVSRRMDVHIGMLRLAEYYACNKPTWASIVLCTLRHIRGLRSVDACSRYLPRCWRHCPDGASRKAQALLPAL